MTPPAQPLLAYTLPDGWVSIGIPRTRTEVAQTATALTAAYPDLAPVGERLIARIAAACALLDVLHAHATVVDTAAGPQLVTLVASARPAGTGTTEAGSLAGLVRELARGPGPAPEVRLLDLPAGSALRAEWLRDQYSGSPNRLFVQYLLEAAGGREVCVLTFATPAAGSASLLRPVFHQIARSVRCGVPGQASDAGSPCGAGIPGADVTPNGARTEGRP